MAVRLSPPARAAWSVLDSADFGAVDDLLADVAERHSDGEPIDVAGSVDVGHDLVDVLARRAIVAMLTRTPTDIIDLALGRT